LDCGVRPPLPVMPDPHALAVHWHTVAGKFMQQHEEALLRHFTFLVKQEGHDHVLLALQQDATEADEPLICSLGSGANGTRSLVVELRRAKVTPLLTDGIVLWLLERGYRATATIVDTQNVTSPLHCISICFHRTQHHAPSCPFALSLHRLADELQ